MRQRHLYHLVTPSPWPFITSITALLIPLGAVQYMHSPRGYATLSSFNKPIIITHKNGISIDVNVLAECIMQYFKAVDKSDNTLKELENYINNMGDRPLRMPKECYQAAISPDYPHLVDMEFIKDPPWASVKVMVERITEYHNAMIHGVPPGKLEMFIKRYDDSVLREEQDNKRGKVLHEIYMDLENIVKEMSNVNITNVDIIQKCKEVEASLNNIKEKLSDLYIKPSIENSESVMNGEAGTSILGTDMPVSKKVVEETLTSLDVQFGRYKEAITQHLKARSTGSNIEQKSDELKPFSSSDFSEEVHQSSNYSNKSAVIQQTLETTDTATIYEIIAALPISSIAATIFMVIGIVFTYVKIRAIMRLIGMYVTARISLFYYKRRSNKLPKI
jgi:hypothetical protein